MERETLSMYLCTKKEVCTGCVLLNKLCGQSLVRAWSEPCSASAVSTRSGVGESPDRAKRSAAIATAGATECDLAAVHSCSVHACDSRVGSFRAGAGERRVGRRAAQIVFRALRKFACYVGERHTRHGTPESGTHGMRGSFTFVTYWFSFPVLMRHISGEAANPRHMPALRPSSLYRTLTLSARLLFLLNNFYRHVKDSVRGEANGLSISSRPLLGCSAEKSKACVRVQSAY